MLSFLLRSVAAPYNIHEGIRVIDEAEGQIAAFSCGRPVNALARKVFKEIGVYPNLLDHLTGNRTSGIVAVKELLLRSRQEGYLVLPLSELDGDYWHICKQTTPAPGG